MLEEPGLELPGSEVREVAGGDSGCSLHMTAGSSEDSCLSSGKLVAPGGDRLPEAPLQLILHLKDRDKA